MSATKFVWFITGANSGFGLLLTQLALSHGHTVVATARSLSKFPRPLRENPDADLIELQITASGTEITAAVDAAMARHGRLDVLVNNAGFGHMGALEEVTEAEARYQFDVNFFGPFNLARAAVPHMRRQGSGVVVQVSSGAGIWAGQGAPVYAASKFALEGLSEALAGEVRGFGIRVHLVEPGIFRTEFLAPTARGQNVGGKVDGYIDIGGILAGMHGKQPGDPKKGVERMFEIVMGTGLAKGKEWDVRVPLGSDAFWMLEQKVNSLVETKEKMKNIAVSTDF